VNDPGASSSAEDEAIPVSVRLGTVVAPEDPEDWTRPLTWVAALGMLLAPIMALAWFLVAAPRSSLAPLPGTWAVALAMVIGASAAGGTQMGRLRAFAGTLASALFAALVTVAIGLGTAGERQVGVASPTLAHAFAAAVAGLAGAVPASLLAPLVAARPSRALRILLPTAVGTVVALVILPQLFAGTV
jgi:hypothetical protein